MKKITELVALLLIGVTPQLWAAGNISAVWANEGGDKVAREELRVSKHVENLTGETINRVWDGKKISLFAAQNEVVGFQVIMEAATAKASSVSINFNVLTGPNNEKIRTSGTNPEVWVNRPIELFYERYLQIQGLSFFGYSFEESQIPTRFRAASRKWVDRPDHDKSYPDPLVPIEKVPTFDIQPQQSQGIWCDVFVTKGLTPGLYKGSFKIEEGGVVTRQIPIELTVMPFSLPDVATDKTMLFIDNSDLEWRYVTKHGGYAQWTSPGGRQIQYVMDKTYQLLHRHKISAIGENECPFNDKPCDSSIPRLDGSLFTPANGYDGPGIGVQNGVYSIGTYGSWGNATFGIPEWDNNQQFFNQHMDGFGTWFQNNLPNTDVFLYTADEPPQSLWPQVQKWADWLSTNPGPGKRVKSFSTMAAVNAMLPPPTGLPSLQIPTTQAGVGVCPVGDPTCKNTDITNQAYDKYSHPPNKFWMYNDGHPGVGTFDTEADGVDSRTIGVAQYKKGIDRWFYWEGDVNSNFDTFATATTWGSRDQMDPQRGLFSNISTNGNGLLFYPGTDLDHPSNSYGINVPIASIRLKEWRRGIQDADYFKLASAVDANATNAVMNSLYPKALWENTVQDPSWPITPITWSSNPDVWENARYQLAQIIMKNPAPVPPVPTPTPVPVPTPTPTPAPSPVPVNAPPFAITSYVQLVAKSSGKCLGTTVAGTKPGPVLQETCRSAGQQKLRFTAVQGGYEISVLHSRLQLDIQGGPAATENGAALTQYPYWGGSNEVFWLEKSPNGDDYYLVHPRNSGSCLDVSGLSKADGAVIQQWSCTYADNQKWSIRQIN